MTKVDLGAGTLCQNKIDRYKRYMGEEYNPKDYIGVDCSENNGIDKICNFETEKLPFNDDSVDAIITMHTLEHINNLAHIVKECHRILKPKCKQRLMGFEAFTKGHCDIWNSYHRTQKAP